MREPADVKRSLVKLLEFIRIIGTAFGFYLTYAALDVPSSPDSIRILALTFAIAMCGTLTLEGLFLAKATSREKGYSVVGDEMIDPYQIQNTMWFLAATTAGVVWPVWFPDATSAFLLYVVLIGGFFVLSAVNHAWQAIGHRNRTWQNLSRPFLSLAMVGGSLPIIMSYL
jgi:hypothetical protein